MNFGDFAEYLSLVNIFLTLLVCLLVSFFLKKNQNRNIPHGPLSLPLIGNLHQLGKEPHLSIFNYSKTYGAIYRLYFGQQLFIIISGKKLSYDVLVSRSAEFSQRPNLPFCIHASGNGKSFALSPMTATEHKLRKTIALTAIKKTEKKFSLFNPETSELNQSNDVKKESDNPTSVTDGLEKLFGQEAVIMGRKLVHLGQKFRNKFSQLTHSDDKYKKEVMHTAKIYSITSMCAVIFGQRYMPEDEEPTFVGDIFEEMANQQQALNMYSSFPFLQKIWRKPLNTYIGSGKALLGLAKMHVDECRRQVQHQKRGLDHEESDNRSTSKNVIENLLELKSQEPENTSWDDKMTNNIVSDIFGAAVDTGMTFSLWFCVYSTVFTVESRKAQAEVDAFVNKNHRMPRYNERLALPYLNSFIFEVLRHSCFVPLTIPHAPLKNTTLNGYNIPQNACVVVSFMSLNWDENIWECPNMFRPERFIKTDGSFNKDLADKVNIHGGGRRLCAGVTISRIQMFASSASLLHTFQFNCIDKNNNVLPKSSWFITLIPNKFNFVLSERPD